MRGDCDVVLLKRSGNCKAIPSEKQWETAGVGIGYMSALLREKPKLCYISGGAILGIW